MNKNNYKILLIDDEPNIIRALMRILDDARYTVLTANRPADAMRILENDIIDVILCDQQMHDMLGIDVLKYAKKIQPDAIRILVTGSSDMNVAIAAINEGSIYHFFTKPWDNDELLSVVQSALHQKRALEEKDDLLKLMSYSKDSLLEVTNKLGVLGNLIQARSPENNRVPSVRKILVEDDETIIPVSVSEVLYIASIDDAVVLVTKHGRYRTQESLNALETKLGRESFFRCHRSYIVNIEEIDRITPWFNGAYNIKLKGVDENIPVSRSNTRKLKELFEY